MNSNCFVGRFAGWIRAGDLLARTWVATLEHYPVLLLAGLALLLSGCATHRGAARFSISEVAGSRVPKFGSLAFADDSAPASFGFQKAKGKLGSAKEAILDSAEMGLSGPGAGVIVTGAVLSCGEWGGGGGDPWGEVMMAGAVGGVTAIGAALAGPVVGAQGLIRSFKKLSPAELAECEAALTNALTQMAAQQQFHRALLQTAAETIRPEFLCAEPGSLSEGIDRSAAATTLEARVDDLRLERAGSSEDSYVLRIQARARLVRLADGAICFEQCAEYRSGKALFLDWTMQGAIEGVAQTGYRVLAQYYINQLLVDSPERRQFVSSN